MGATFRRAEIIGRLEALAEAGAGRLTPEAVVLDASDPDSPLHGEFEWDDRKAGDAWRLEQARQLIRGVKVLITTETRTINTVAYVRDPSAMAHQQGYVSIVKLKDSTEEAREAIDAEFRSADSALRRAKSIAAALGMEDAVDELLHGVTRVRELAAS